MRKRVGVLAVGAGLLLLSGCTPEVGPLQRISATIVASPVEGQAPLAVHFDATRSADPEGPLTDHLWDFGDGSPVVAGREIQHTYQRAGEYLVTLVVVGPSGTGRATTFVRALNNPPTAAFTFLPADPFQGESVSFDASASSDPDADIAHYAWDFGDGATGEGKIVSHAFANPGEFLVILTVTDAAGAEARATRLVKVEDCSSGGCGRR
ncbi:MAG: PKD domain-containing protein [Candidatus Bipolaricaulis sp.]|nr:PKD domain-containing protein [Candidatus Bipolaricaulis sp.]MDY0392535.1 PKD domain-containing protein [Candidatus Bipolaricaulis sp.]